jgi:hypothetical protein
MTALTPSVIQKSTDEVQDAVTGTPVRTESFSIKVTKAAQNDTIVTTTHLGSSYTTDKIIALDGITIPTGGDSVQEAPTVDDSADSIVLASATAGTTWIHVTFSV